MADSNPSSLDQSRSTSVTNSSRTTHQRKPSFSISSNLYAIPEKSSPSVTQQQQQQQPPSTPEKYATTTRISPHSATWRRYLDRIAGRFDSLFNPSGPLLPHDKHGGAFGGTQKRFWLASLSQPVRFLLLFYVVFSVFFTINHTWNWFFSPSVQLDERFGDHWKPERTYDADQPYSVLDNMTHGLQMSKLFSKSFYDATKATDPFWLKGEQVPESGDITLVTAVTPGTWNELERLAGYWKGPISAVLHASKDDDDMTTLSTIRESYNRNQEVASWVDVHLVRHAGPPVSVLLPRNAERNLARLLARTEYIVELSSNIVPATNVRRTFNTNRKIFEALLKGGDMLVVPTFGFPDHDLSQYTIPYHKSRLLELVDGQQMGLTDRHWDMNEGPTNLVRWRDSTTLYSVENYHYDYEPIVVESKRVQPWCTERFLDRRSACFLSSYLAGGEFWVLPDDFMVRLPESKEYIMPDLDHVVENRLYAKFYWEQCVHHARQLDALGLWKGPRSEHVRKQCSRVIQNWGKGLIGRPE